MSDWGKEKGCRENSEEPKTEVFSLWRTAKIPKQSRRTQEIY